MTKKKLSLNPPTSKSVEEFISEAENKISEDKTENKTPESKDLLPWEMPEINGDRMGSLRLGIHEEYLLKLKYLSEQSGIPQQKIARSALYPAINAYLEELANKGFIKL